MRYQIRLLDQNLPGFTREIAQACWRAADGLVPQKLATSLYRDLYRSVREVFRKHVSAFRYCNAASVCEWSIPRRVTSVQPRHEQFAGEHVHVYLMDPEGAPGIITREIVERALKDIATNLPGQLLPGLAHVLQNLVTKTLDQRIFLSERCGEDNLCHLNEAYDPWDMREPINHVRPAI